MSQIDPDINSSYANVPPQHKQQDIKSHHDCLLLNTDVVSDPLLFQESQLNPVPLHLFGQKAERNGNT